MRASPASDVFTGDVNILKVTMAVLYQVADPVAYLTGTEDPDALVRVTVTERAHRRDQQAAGRSGAHDRKDATGEQHARAGAGAPGCVRFVACGEEAKGYQPRID